jgi:FdhE protein
MVAGAKVSSDQWQLRAERAKELQHQYPAAAELLRFCAAVLEFQGKVALGFKQQANPAIALREQIDLAAVESFLPELFAVVRKHGPAALGEVATNLQNAGPSTWHTIFAAAIDESPHETFFARACLQPVAEKLQEPYPESTDQSARQCPVCGGLPQVIILRPEGEGARRSLQCSFCLREWGFRRVLCASCGETDKVKLPYYTAEECKHVRVEACDTCRHYVKSVDLSLDGLAIPLVDEVALAALDVWAVEHGYTKIQKNLLGM